MKKIIVIGSPGSGKSTFARALHTLTGIPLFHLDMMYWNPDKTIVSRELFLERLSLAMKGDEWIIDGNFSSTMRERIKACDTVFFLDYQTEVCLEGVRARRGKPRSDIPWMETEEDAEFTEFIKGFRENRRPAIIELLSEYEDKRIIVFKEREEADKFLNGEIE